MYENVWKWYLIVVAIQDVKHYISSLKKNPQKICANAVLSFFYLIKYFSTISSLFAFERVDFITAMQ